VRNTDAALAVTKGSMGQVEGQVGKFPAAVCMVTNAVLDPAGTSPGKNAE